MISMTSSPDRLWALASEFGQRARAHPGKVERAILGFLAAEAARHQAARCVEAEQQLDSLAGAESAAMASSDFNDEEKRELRSRFEEQRSALAMQAGVVFRERLAASQPEPPSLDEKIAYLARVHDEVIGEDPDGDRRESRRPLAPALYGAAEVHWATLLLLPEEDLQRMRADLEEKGSCRAVEYLAEVRRELPLPGEAGQG